MSILLANQTVENAPLTACEHFSFRVNTVPYSPDNKTFIVTVFTCVFIGLACPCTIIANVLVFLGILRKPDLRNVYNTSILFLATSDLLSGLITLPAFVAYQGSKLTKPEKDFSCVALVLYTFTTFLITGLSVMTIILITIERYVAIFHPLKYRCYLTKHRIAIIISLVWVLWTVFITMARFFPGASPGMYSVIAAALLIPCIILTFFVYFKVYALTRRIRVSIGHELTAPRSAENIRETKSSRTVAYIAGALVLCFVPTLAIAVIYMRSGSVSRNYFFHLLYPLTDTAALLTPILDPVIYVLRSSSVRTSLREMLRDRRASTRTNRARTQTGPTATTGLEMTAQS